MFWQIFHFLLLLLFFFCLLVAAEGWLWPKGAGRNPAWAVTGMPLLWSHSPPLITSGKALGWEHGFSAGLKLPLHRCLLKWDSFGHRWVDRDGHQALSEGQLQELCLVGFLGFFLFTITRESFGKKKFTWGKNDHRLRFLGSMMNTQSEKSTLIRIDSLLLKIYIWGGFTMGDTRTPMADSC